MPHHSLKPIKFDINITASRSALNHAILTAFVHAKTMLHYIHSLDGNAPWYPSLVNLLERGPPDGRSSDEVAGKQTERCVREWGMGDKHEWNCRLDQVTVSRRCSTVRQVGHLKLETMKNSTSCCVLQIRKISWSKSTPKNIELRK
jgi:hypothetical protein